MESIEARDSLALFQNSGGTEVRATILQLARHGLVLEIYSPYVVVQNSELLPQFKILVNDQLVYSGKAVITKVIHTATACVCEASLEDGWSDVGLFGGRDWREKLSADFRQFLRSIQTDFKI